MILGKKECKWVTAFGLGSRIWAILSVGCVTMPDPTPAIEVLQTVQPQATSPQATGFLGKRKPQTAITIQKLDFWANWGFRSPTFAKSRKSWAISITLGLATGCLLAPAPPALAQLIEDTAPDRALGTTLRTSPTNAQIQFVEGGKTHGINLFHSFQNFNVGANRGVYFANPTGIQNILTRVTGSNRSDIQGTLGVLGTANLFLINPNGIILGPNASLDLRGGSFYGSTASGLKFGDLGEFSATNPQPPSPLLTIKPSAFFFTAQQRQAEIVNQSQATRTVLNASTLGLRVRNGQTLLLLGGEVTIKGGRLTAFDGRLEIGAVSGATTVGLNTDNSLNIPAGVERVDVIFSGGAIADTRLGGARGGDIRITAGNIYVLSGSQILTGIGPGFGTSDSQAGDIKLNATGTIQIDQSYIQNAVEVGSIGKGGNIFADASSLMITEGGFIGSGTSGTGNAGNVQVNAKTIVLDGGGIGQ
jgi:filamentous hemagglutinin family protein